MKTLIGMAAIGLPMVMSALGNFSAGMLTLAGLAGLGCWVLSGWFGD
jgi:hypothetical protein